MNIKEAHPEIVRLWNKAHQLGSSYIKFHEEDSESFPAEFVTEVMEMIISCEARGFEILEPNDGPPEVSVHTNVELYDLHRACERHNVPYISLYSTLFELKIDEVVADYMQRRHVVDEFHGAIVKYKEEWTPRLVERIDAAINRKDNVAETLKAIVTLLRSVDPYTVSEVANVCWKHEWLLREVSVEEISLRILARRVHR